MVIMEREKTLSLSFGIFLILDLVFTEISLKLRLGTELNPFYNFYVFCAVKIIISWIVYYKREIIDLKWLYIINVIPLFLVLNHLINFIIIIIIVTSI